jgi:hypothetical protein
MRIELEIALAIAIIACDAPQGSPKPPPQPVEASASVAETGSAHGVAAPDATTSAPTATPAPEAIIAQHVLVTYRGAKRAPKAVTRTKFEARTRASEALAKIRTGTPFEEVVKTYSDDTATIDRMGSLGKFRRDAMDPAFASAAFALTVGAVSDVVETPFGFHVIRRTQ